MISLLILPTQLFEIKYLPKIKHITLYEHPHYFLKYKYNKKKLILHHASMKYYKEYLQNKGYKVKYVSFNSDLPNKQYTMFEPIDKISLPKNIIYIKSPNFLLSIQQLNQYQEKTTKYSFTGFYTTTKKWLNILPKIKSQDKNNRKSLPKNVSIPNVPSNNNDQTYISSGIKFVKKHFPNNPGTVENFIFPISHSTSKTWLTKFINEKIKLFGDYQDAIDSSNNFLFHSLLSTSINIGLLNPKMIIDKVLKKSNIPINSLEGFIRQLFWREYQRYCYLTINFKKHIKQKRIKLRNIWYTGKTGIPPVDDAIKKAFDSGYLHHIERLMIVGNYMNLTNVDPREGHKWFMEFSCDSYEWVMAQNVYDMVFYVTKGLTMRRPYISSSNYIIKMSNYKCGDWCNIWNKKYNNYIKKNKLTYYRLAKE
jgi:deoxyribodipyrimidine photolyase-related protein